MHRHYQSKSAGSSRALPCRGGNHSNNGNIVKTVVTIAIKEVTIAKFKRSTGVCVI